MGRGGIRHRVEVTVLGGFSIRVAGRAITLRPSCRRLVALLATMGPLDRSTVAGRLYPDLDGSRALGNLRTVLWRVRDQVEHLVGEDGDRLVLQQAVVDVTELLQWCEDSLDGSAAPNDAHLPPGAMLDLLPGWSDEWLTEVREQLRMSRILALEANAERQLAVGHFGVACRFALAAVRLDQLRESAVRLLVDAHLRLGNTVEAVRRYRWFEQLLWEELQTSPGAALRALVAPVLSMAALPGEPRVAWQQQQVPMRRVQHTR